MIVITTYPQKLYTNGGVATATKKLLDAWKRKYPRDRVHVLAEQFAGAKEKYTERGQKIYRVWKPNNLRSFLATVRQARKLGKQKLLLQLELAIYGGPLATAGLMLMLLALRIFAGWPIYTVVHQVVLDITTLSGHIGIKRGSIKAGLYNNLLLPSFYKLCSFSSAKMIVFEPELEDRLHKLGCRNTKLIPHGVDNKRLSAKQRTKNGYREFYDIAPDEFVVTLFGFVTWYKGHDLLLKVAKQVKNKKVRFLIAGGESPSQKTKSSYQEFYKKFIKEAGKLDNVTFTGFVQESGLGKIFHISDLMVFPYRTMMSSSGPLALSIAYEKPFLLSNKLKPVLSSPEFDQFDKEQKRSLLFTSTKDLAARIDHLAKHKDELRKLKKISLEVKRERVWGKLVGEYRELGASTKLSGKKQFLAREKLAL